MKLKTSELTGVFLDWTVHVALHGECEGYPEYEYSTDWAQGGPIIEREGMLIAPDPCGWEARHPGDDGDSTEAVGPTPLIAAMRCYVASKLGDEVDVPDELIEMFIVPLRGVTNYIDAPDLS